MNPESQLSRRVQSIRPSAIRRFFDLVNEMKEGAISLSIGEPDFVTPWAIREAGIHSLENGHTHYSPNQGFRDLRVEIARYLDRRFGLRYDPDREMVVTVGGSEAIDLALRALIDPGDEVVVPEPCFVSYLSCAVLSDAKVVTVPCVAEDGFKLDPERLRAALTPRTKAVVLGFPSNPTGAVMTRDELARVVEVLEGSDCIVISDELYAELTYAPATHCSIASFPSMRDRTVVVNGFSKAYAMTGWRIGYACGPAPILAAMNKIHQYAIMCSPTTAQYAATEALRSCDEDVRAMVEEYDRRRRAVVDGVRKAGLSCFDPLGAFYAFPDIRATGMDSTTFAETFLSEEKVAVVPGNAFGAAGEGYVRICYAYSIDHIEEAMHRLQRFTEKRVR
jgi:aminotransferase